MKLYEKYARTLYALQQCEKRLDAGVDALHWHAMVDQHKNTLDTLDRKLPSGSGFDSGVTPVLDESRPERLVFRVAFYHMDASGGYGGWSEHKVIVTPSLVTGFAIRVTGRDRRQIKEYIIDTMATCLEEELP